MSARIRNAVAAAGGLVDVTEAAAILGVSRQAVQQRHDRAAERKWLGFVEPVGYLPADGRAAEGSPGSPVWTRDQMNAQREVDEAQRA